MTDLIARATREVCAAGGCERTALLRALHERDHTIEHLVQANHALHDELAAARARIAALENQLDELGEGAYRAAAERDNRYVPQLHEWKGRAERAEAELARLRPVVEAARMALDDLLSDATYGLNHRTEG